MPANLVTGSDATDVAAYVAYAASRSGEDTGALATAGLEGATSGEEIFVAAGCGSCHAFSKAGTNGNVGPSLDELASAAGEQGQGSPEEYVQQSILDPDAVTVEGFQSGVMPSYEGRLSEKQVQALSEYLLGGQIAPSRRRAEVPSRRAGGRSARASSSRSFRASRPSFSTLISAFLPLALTRQRPASRPVLQHRARACDRPEQPLAQGRLRAPAAAGWASADRGRWAESSGRLPRPAANREPRDRRSAPSRCACRPGPRGGRPGQLPRDGRRGALPPRPSRRSPRRWPARRNAGSA